MIGIVVKSLDSKSLVNNVIKLKMEFILHKQLKKLMFNFINLIKLDQLTIILLKLLML